MTTISKSKKSPAPPASIEKIELRYMPVSEAVLFDRNPKKHDIAKIAESIARYGMRNPPIWDVTLNDGEGGIVAGNGRTETLRSMELQKQPVPRGIAIDEQGRWCMPIIFGCNAVSEFEAIAYAIDDNNLTMAGDFSDFDIAKLWEREGYLELLTSIADEEVLPVTVDADAIASLLAGIDDDGSGSGGQGEEKEKAVNDLIDKVEDSDYVPRVKPGEIWRLGRHYIACGSCTEEAHLDALLELADKTPDVVWADPPYGISIVAANET
ncbi:MAG: hypothetical protein ACRC62_15110, partial [Microcoleus sp.]